MASFRRLIAVVLALLAPLAPAGGQASQEGGRRALTVPDIVSMQRIEEPSLLTIAGGGSARLATSPDGSHAAIVVSQADLRTNSVTYRIIVFDAGEVGGCPAEAARCLAAGHTLVEIRSDSGAFLSPLRSLSWTPDGRAILFMAPGEVRHPGTFGERLQVFRAELSGGPPKQVSHADRSVEAYSWHAPSGTLVYTARLPDRQIDDGGAYFVAGANTALQVALPNLDDIWMPLYQRYVEKPDGAARPIGTPQSAWFENRTWISPDGRWAIGRASVSDQEALDRWHSRYMRLRGLTSGNRADPAIMQSSQSFVGRLILYDLSTGSGRPLFDAPDGGNIVGGPDSVGVAWRPDSRSVAIANTFVPCGGGSTCRDGTAVVEYRLADSSLREIERIESAAPQGLDWLSDGRVEVDAGNGVRRVYAVGPAGWVAAGGGSGARAAVPRFEFVVAQDANTPPDVALRDLRSGRQRLLSQLNPQFDRLTFGRVEPFAWTGEDGHHWAGGLVLPPGYRPRQRYPVVVQTYGFSADSFVIDGFGGIASAYAAQAMANRNMIVLLLPHDSAANTRAGILLYRAGIRAAIGELARRGMVDPQRAGIIGFSGMGSVPRDMITFSDVPFAAASIADAGNYTLTAYSTWLYGFFFDGPLAAEDRAEAQPFGDSLATWVERDASLHTDRITAALRLEDYGPSAVPSHWDLYVLLRRQHKPVEQLIFRHGSHQLRRPAERLASLGGNTDWFDFWLNGHEDSDPGKAEQYRRWRAMRDGWRRQQAWEAAGHPAGSMPPADFGGASR